MKLSVVIVNYNVEYFLEQCLYSVRRAMQGIEGEVFVVDNNSVDGSLRMLAQKFPEVKVIANDDHMPPAAERGDFLPRAVKTALRTLDKTRWWKTTPSQSASLSWTAIPTRVVLA